MWSLLDIGEYYNIVTIHYIDVIFTKSDKSVQNATVLPKNKRTDFSRSSRRIAINLYISCYATKNQIYY